MANLRRTFVEGRMNKDTDTRLLKEGEYRDAENILIIDSEGSDVGAVQNSLSTKKLTNINFGANPICLGGFPDEATQKLYWVIKSDVGTYLLEYDVKNQAVSKILEDTRTGTDRVFDLKETHLITAMNKIISGNSEKDMILLNDDNLQPLCFNIEIAKTYGPNGFDKEDIFLIKKPPRYAPQTFPVMVDGAGNNIEEKFLSFSYRYKYLNGEYSALSSYSNYNFYPKKFQLDFEVLDNIGMVNAYNAIRISINTGDKRVTDIQVIVKGSNSNILYIIETFNKENEGWGNNENRNFVFSNNKIYIALPEKELYRPYDNVPLKVKAQTVIGNRPIFGNFLEGYDLIDKNNSKIKLNYNLSIISESLEGNPVPINLTTVGSVPNDVLNINFSGISLKSGSKINIFISLKNNQTPSRNYNDNFQFMLTKDYIDTAELAQDPDFVFFFTNYVTNLFLANYTINDILNDILNSEFESNTTFTVYGYTSTSISIKTPELVYRVDDTPLNDLDNPANTHTVTIGWGFEAISSVLFYEIGSVSTVKSNRSYEAGIIYMDDFNRSTTVLTQLKNTIFIPHDLALSKNKIKVNLFHNPPAFADRYKIVIKQQKMQYQTIYATTFYIDGVFRWIKLENDNKDKVKVGEYLIFKSDTNGFVPTLTKVKVLELATKEKEFIAGNVDINNAEIKELPGYYMKIKLPAGISMDYIDNLFIEKKDTTNSKGDNFNIWIGPFSNKNETSGLYEDIPITQGSRIDINLHNNRKFDGDWKDLDFTKTYFASQDYANFEVWYNTEVNNNTSPFLYPTNGFVRGIVYNNGFFKTFTPSSTGALYLQIHNEYNGNGQHKSYLNGSVKIIAANGLIILETEEKKSIEEEIFYETAQIFDIVNGFHQGNLQNQNSVLPAVIDLDFFNCFCQGNGAESYIIKDAFNKPYLNNDLRPSAVSIEKYKAVRRYADLTYGDPYIESSNINGLNVFNASTGNFKELDKQYGSIQKLHSRDNDILVLKESKASKVMFEKGLLTNSDGSTNVTSIDKILGPEIMYLGDNGIGKNPESFAENDYQIYYANTKQGTVSRLSIDGVTDIIYGMVDWFRDIFRLQPNSKKLGGFDPYTKQYVISVGNEPEKVLQLQCGNEIIKDNQAGSFSYELKLNDLSGDIILNYNITAGNATIVALFNEISHVVSNVSGLGNITFNRDSLVENVVLVTITAVSSTISYEIGNVCPIGSELKIVSIIVNDAEDVGKNSFNRFKWGSSFMYSTDDLFDAVPVSKFFTETGIEGVGKFPLNNSIFTVQSFKDSLASGEFLLTECNRIGYIVSDTIYEESDINAILSAATYLDITESEEEGYYKISSGSFLFNRTEPDQLLYLIWDYTNRKPILIDDTASAVVGGSVIIDVLDNDDVIDADVTVTIFTNPTYGTAVVNLDKTITYTHDGTANYEDVFVYKVDNGVCSSTASVFINLGVPCSGSITASGGTGIYETVINVGTALGLTGIKYNAQSVPDRFEIYYDDIKVADSKYVGDGLSAGPPVSYSGLLGLKSGFHIFNYNGATFDDTGMIEPDFTVIQSDIADNIIEAIDGNGTLLFDKTTASPTTIKIRVTGTSGTGWTFSGVCPIADEDLKIGDDKIMWGFYDDANKDSLAKTKSMKCFLQTSPLRFYTNIKGDTDFNSYGYTSTNRFMNDGITWWEINPDGTIISTGTI